MEKKLYFLKIDPKISTIAPPLKEAEWRVLEEDLLRNGCIDPLIVWKGIIVDGHVRYEICHRHQIPFAVIEHEFENYEEACIWGTINQIGRRNLSLFQKCEMVMPLKPVFAERARKRQGSRKPLEGPPEDVRQHLADLAGVSHNTLGRAVWLIENADQETLRRVRNGEISINGAYSSMRTVPKGKPADLSIPERRQSAALKENAGSKSLRSSVEEARNLIRELVKEVRKENSNRYCVLGMLSEVSEVLEKIS